MIKATFDIEPLAKQSTRFSNGKAYTEKKYKDWQEEFMWLAKEKPKFSAARFRRGVRMVVHYRYAFKKSFPSLKTMYKWSEAKQEKERVVISKSGVIYKATQPDLHDNLNKLLLDTLQKMQILSNDGIVVIFTASKYYASKPAIFIEIDNIRL